MAYKPLSQTVSDDAVFANPSSEAVFELAKEKADVDLQNLSITGTNGQVLTLGASGPYWEDVAASGGGGSAEYPPQGGNAGKFLQTNGSEVSWQAVTGFEPTVSLTSDRVVISNASGKLAVSSVTPTTLGYLDVSSSVTGLLAEKANIALSNLSGTTAINSTLLFQTDNTYDIGSDGASRPAAIHAANHVTSPTVKGRDNVIGAGQHDITVRGGNGLTGNKDGGNLTLAGGTGVGSGVDGEILLQSGGATRLKIGATGNIQASGITASRALVTDASSNITASSITATQLEYLSSASGDIQTQINGKEPTLTKGNLTESTSSVLTISGGTGSVIGSGTTIQVKQASGSQSGFLASSDFTTFSNKQNTITGAATTITTSDLTASRAVVSDASGKVSVSSVSAATLGFLDATSSVQTQINSKQATITGAATTITSSDLTASRVLVSDASGKVSAASVTTTTLGFLDPTSSIQTQLNAKEPTLTKGNLTESTSSVLTITGGTGSVIGSGTTIQVKQASASQSGFLSSADFSTFNGKQNTITGGASSITTSDLTASRALVSDASGKVSASSVTSATLAFLDATSSVQTQINGKQNIGNYITGLTGDVTASGPGSVAATVAQVAGTSVSTATANTTDATVTTLQTIATSSNSILGIEVKVAGLRTGGASGTTNDSAYYVLHGMAKNNSGTVTISTVVSSEFEDQSGWDADLVASGTNILVRVTGAAGNNISWRSSTQTISI